MNLEPAVDALARTATGRLGGGVRLLAHQGGWDEILMVVLPLAAVGGLLYLANRQVSARLAAGQAEPEPVEPDGPGQEQERPEQHRDQNQA